MVKYWRQAQDNIMNLPLVNGWGEKHHLLVKWKYVESKAAAYYYHGLILDEGSTGKFHGMAVAALQAADEYFKESKKACDAFNAAPPLSRNPSLWGAMKFLSGKIPKDTSSKVRINRDLYSHERIMETAPTLPDFALALNPDDYQLPPVDASWNMEQMNKGKLGSNQLRNDSRYAIMRDNFLHYRATRATQNQRELANVEKKLSVSHEHTELYGAFSSLISRIQFYALDVKDVEFAELKSLLGESELINFDTTSLVALVSGLSNSGTDKLLATLEGELRKRFKDNYEFVIEQVISEIQNPILVELGRAISGKRGIICESVEFKELELMCGGPNEKLRASHLLNCLTVIPHSPSERMMSLPTTRKLAWKNKVAFGIGDYWCAPTITTNMAFVRAISQTGMSLFTIEHRSQALTGDYSLLLRSELAPWMWMAGNFYQLKWLC